MRNASDIFCLKDLEEGKTDGTEMFSVNGQCPLRISRRRNAHASGSFQYGSAPQRKTPDGGRKTKPKTPPQMQEKFNEEIGDEIEIGEEVEGNEDFVEESHENPPQFCKIENGEKIGDNVGVSASNMLRNPLTGAGMEIEEHKKPKKGRGGKSQRWMW